MDNNIVGADGVPFSGDSGFVWQCISYLLSLDLFYFIVIVIVILIVCWLIRFVLTLKEDI